MSNFQTNHFTPLGASNEEENLSLEEKCRQAKAALDRFELVGVHELVSTFYHMMCRFVGLPGTNNLNQANVTRKRPRLFDLDRSLIKRMEALNEANIELCRYVKGLFLKSLREVIVSVPSRDELIKKDICRATTSSNTKRAVHSLRWSEDAIAQGCRSIGGNQYDICCIHTINDRASRTAGDIDSGKLLLV